MEINEKIKNGGIVFGRGGNPETGECGFVCNTQGRGWLFDFTIEYCERNNSYILGDFADLLFASKSACRKFLTRTAEGLKEFVTQENLTLPEASPEDVRKLWSGSYGSFEEAAAAFLSFAENPSFLKEEYCYGSEYDPSEYLWSADPSGYMVIKTENRETRHIRKKARQLKIKEARKWKRRMAFMEYAEECAEEYAG